MNGGVGDAGALFFWGLALGAAPIVIGFLVVIVLTLIDGSNGR